MSANKVLKLMKDKEVDYLDLRFTDPRGKLQHLTMDGKMVDEEMLNEGVFFDGSSIAFNNAFEELIFNFSELSISTIFKLL